MQHSGTSARGRFFLVSLRRRDVRLLHFVLGRFDLSFSRVKLPHWWQELIVECLWLKKRDVCSKFPDTALQKQSPVPLVSYYR